MILSSNQSGYQLFAVILELLLKQTELLRHDSTFLKLVCVAKEVSEDEKSILATDLTPKHFILFLLDISKSFLHSSNKDNLRNVIDFLTFIFSLGAPLPPIDRYFDSSAKKGLPNYDNLFRNVKTPVKLFQTDNFLNQLSSDVTHIFTEGRNLIGGDIPWVDMVIEVILLLLLLLLLLLFTTCSRLADCVEVMIHSCIALTLPLLTSSGFLSCFSPNQLSSPLLTSNWP